MTSKVPRKCGNCGKPSLVKTTTNAAGGHGPDLLPGLHSFFRGAKFTLVLCRECGLTRFFADEAALEKVAGNTKWEAL